MFAPDFCRMFNLYLTKERATIIRGNPKGNKHLAGHSTKINGFSVASKVRLKERITNWYQAIFYNTLNKNEYAKKLGANRAFYFITLTLPEKQKHTDFEIKKELPNLFDNVNYYMPNKYNYIWRAETQMNGNIHFHILIDRFIPKLVFLLAWINILKRLEYFNDTNKQFAGFTVNYQRVGNPVHVARYLRKYCSKSSYSTRRQIDGRHWGHSRGLDKLLCRHSEQISLDEYATIVSNSVSRGCLLVNPNDYTVIIFFNKKCTMESLIPPEISDKVQFLCNKSFSYLRDLDINYSPINWTKVLENKEFYSYNIDKGKDLTYEKYKKNNYAMIEY